MKWSKRARRYDGCSLCNYCPCHEHCSLRERWERAGKRNSEMKAAIVRWRRRLSLASSPLEIWLRELHFHMQAHPACIYYKDPASSPRVFLFSLLFSFLLSRTSCFRQLGIASSGFPIPDFSGPEGLFPSSGNFHSRSGNREKDVIVVL